MTSRRFTLCLIAALCSSAIVVACGGGEGDGELTVDEYVQRVEATFDETIIQLRRLATEYHDKIASAHVEPAEAEVQLILERDSRFLALLRVLSTELDEIDPPRSAQAAHADYRAALDGFIQVYEKAINSETYNDFLVEAAEANIRDRLETWKTAGELRETLAGLQEILPADVTIQKASERLRKACAELNDAAAVAASDTLLPCEL